MKKTNHTTYFLNKCFAILLDVGLIHKKCSVIRVLLQSSAPILLSTNGEGDIIDKLIDD